MEPIKHMVELPPPDPTAPGIFRLANPGDLTDMLQEAGLVDVAEQEFIAEWSYASTDEYFTSLMELAVPIHNLMANLSTDEMHEAKRLIFQAVA